MIPYEELVAALDRYVARNGGTPMSAHAPAGYAPPPPAHDELPAHDVDMRGYDEPHDPDMPHGGGEDATHVGALPGGATPAPLQPVVDEGSNEIDIGDVLADDELS
jgi:hypothetical protein